MAGIMGLSFFEVLIKTTSQWDALTSGLQRCQPSNTPNSGRSEPSVTAHCIHSYGYHLMRTTTSNRPMLTSISSSPNPSAIATAANQLDALTVNPDGFAFNTATGESYTVNSSASLIVQQLQSGATHDQIVQAIAQQFNLAIPLVERDIADFLQQLHTLGLLGGR